MSTNRNLKNLGIIAHIDAGKTTLTERFLLYAGLIHKAGNVHDGNTKTDWMQQERERGITIVSATITFYWKGLQINLVDTPGHLDFNNEVEKCLCVLESAIVVIDSSKGVEPQTECVWTQADRNRVARIIFANKMDKDGAEFEFAVNNLKSRLSRKCIAITYPYIVDNKFQGLYDLVTKCRCVDIDVHTSETVVFEDLAIEEQELIAIKRREMIEQMSEYDDNVMQKFLENDDALCFSAQELTEIIKNMTQNLKIFPIICGSAYKFKNVKHLLNSIIYLKDPEQSDCQLYNVKQDCVVSVKDIKNDFVGFVFKYVIDPYAGAICYTRIYGGSVSVGDEVMNVFTKRTERIKKIYLIQADTKEHITTGYAGQIYGIVIDNVYTSYIICAPHLLYEIHTMKMPEPIIDIAVIPETKQDQDKFSNEIQYYLREDPTLRIRFDTESKQTIISGVGKLQIEILISRMLTEKGIKINTSKPMVAYRETITKSAKEDYKHVKQTGGRGEFARIEMEIHPRDYNQEKNFVFRNEASGREISTNYIEAIMKGVKRVLKCGLYGTPILGLEIVILSGEMHEVDSSSNVFERVAAILLKRLLAKACPIVLVPICKVFIVTPAEFMNYIMGDIHSKKGVVIDCVTNSLREQDIREIECELSGAYVFDYADVLRGISKGMASFKYNLLKYAKCSEETLARSDAIKDK